MSGPTPSFSDASAESSQPSQDAYGLWHQQRVNFYDHGQWQQQPAQQVNYQHPMESNQQQGSYSSYDEMTSNTHPNYLPPPTAPQTVKQSKKMPSGRTMHMPMGDGDNNSNRSDNNTFGRRPGACTRCKKVKMKCDFAPGEKACHRCKPKGYRCVVEAPKPKVYERERLLAEIRQKDAVIESLLKQLYNPYLATPHSIDEYLKSISPPDANEPSVLAWLHHLKSGVQTSTGSSFNHLREGDEEPSEEYSGRLLYNQQCDLLAHRNQEVQVQRQGTRLTGRIPEGSIGIEAFGLANIKWPINVRKPSPSTCSPSSDLRNRLPRPVQDASSPLESSYVPVGLGPDRTFASQKRKERERENVQHDIAGEPESSSELGFNRDHSKGQNSPEILALGLVTMEDSEQLFDVFYKHINPLIGILDPILLTPKSTLARCPVLFTVICAIACRYHPPKSSIYLIAMHFAKHAAANALIQDEMKNIELCQAYILMSIYDVPKRSWDRDQSWLYTGLAVSIATALHLHEVPTAKPANETQEREALNRDRIWHLCFVLDRGTAILFGKPTIILHSEEPEWYKQSPYNLDYDVQLCGYNALLRIISRFHDEVLSDQSRLIHSERGNLHDIIMRYDVEIELFKEEWRRKFRAGGFHREAMLRCSQLHLFVACFRLVIFSFCLHQVFHMGVEAWYGYFLSKSLEYAKSVIRCVNEDLVPSGFMRYAPDLHFMCIAFAAVFLFKLLRPEFSSLLDTADRDESVDLIGTLIEKFSSSDIAVDDRHTPKLYARFLATMLDKYQRSGQGTTFGGSQTILQGNMGIPRHIPGEIIGEGSDNRPSSAAQDHQNGYDSMGFTYRLEATDTAGTWPVQFGSGVGFPHFIYGSENINGNIGAGGQGGRGGEMFTAEIQELNNPEWFQGMPIPGFAWFETHPSA